MAVVLVVEDEPSVRMLTEIKLKPYFTVLGAGNGEEALEVMAHQHVDLLVCDIMMPDMDGYELVEALRESGEIVPVIMVTARDAFDDKRRGFSLGADDYMVKPIHYEELIWRINALLRRAKIHSENRITLGDLTLDAKTYTVTRGEQKLELPKKEFELLYKLLSYPGVISTKNQLLDEIWGYDSTSDESTIKTHISRLRGRFDDAPEFKIVTIKGVGYKAEVQAGL